MTVQGTSSGVIRRRLAVAAAVVLLGGLGLLPSAAQGPTGVDSRLDWWREARFGLFIHWGLYAVPAGEWNGRTDYGEWIRNNARIPLDTYDQFRARFNPTKFDADVWVRTAKAAGMKYIVITTKHHDGFALWDSNVSGFDVMATPFQRDILKELAVACQRHGIRLCFYHSIMDWHHPDYLPRRPWEAADRPEAGASFDRYVAYMKAQLRELLTEYGPVGILWFDGQWEGTWTNERGRDLYNFVRSFQPSIIVNNRVGRAGGDWAVEAGQGNVGDYGTPEQEIPATGVPGLDWETCMTMNRNWGFNRADHDYKSTEALVRNLIDIASKGGNFLLNVGPTADGEFPAESVERLTGIGAWMRINGESIYGTQASPLPAVPWGRVTRRALDGEATRLYLHVFDAPGSRIVVPGLLNEIRAARLLGTGAPLVTARRGDDIEITLPSAAVLEGPAAVVALDIAGEPDVTWPPVIEGDAPIFVDDMQVRISSDRRQVDVRATLDGRGPDRTDTVVSGPIRLRETTTVKARAFRGAVPVSPVAEATFTRVEPRPAVTAAVHPGLVARFATGEFTVLPDFEVVPAALTAVVGDFDLSQRPRQAQFAVRFAGYVRVPARGVYRLFVRSDDGSRLWIGKTLVVDNDGLHGSREQSGYIALEAGLHPMVVAMFEADGGFDLAVSWTPPGGRKSGLPASALWHSGVR